MGSLGRGAGAKEIILFFFGGLWGMDFFFWGEFWILVKI